MFNWLQVILSILFRFTLDDDDDDNYYDGTLENGETERNHRQEQGDIHGYRRSVSRREVNWRPDDLLDLDGPVLWLGIKRWSLYYQIFGYFNWLDRPLYLSFYWRLFMLALAGFANWNIVWELMGHVGFFDGSVSNLILIFSMIAAAIGFTSNGMFIFYENSFNMSPMLKILTTPKLCSLNAKYLKLFGDCSVIVASMFVLLTTLVLELENFTKLETFPTLSYLIIIPLRWVANSTVLHYSVGSLLIDFYVRVCLGCWIQGLKFSLESRFVRFNRYKQEQLARWRQNFLTNSSQINHKFETLDLKEYYFVEMSDIQKELNNMDNHLEISRLFQTNSLISIAVLAFIGNGVLFQFGYDMIANRDNIFTGTLALTLGLIYTMQIFACYIADQWLSHSLICLTNFIEAGFFLENGKRMESLMKERIEDDVLRLLERSQSSRLMDLDNSVMGESIEHSDEAMAELAPCVQASIDHLVETYGSLMIRKEDVLFCREFLNQFENHLATPWTRLDFESHLHILTGFTTLIAAQIIFDENY